MTEDPAIRRRTMQAVKSKDTVPELTVRRLAHRMGYRFRLHRKDLPGKPDLAFPKLHKALFVHGCFWHGHNCARGARVPVQNRDYWIEKIARNKERDIRAHAALKAIGWSSLALWECQLKDADAARNIIRRFLESNAAS
jgi:DNA mismatch endonuclease (patch repair protein)